MTYLEIIGYASAAVGILIFAMKRMIPLRITGIVHNIGQIAFGLLAGIYPTVIQHAILLPLNIYRLFEMIWLIRRVKEASTGDQSVDWLRPFMDRRSAKTGEVLFRKGDEADRLFFVLEGKLRILEIGVIVNAGNIVGELGMLAPGRKRSQTIVAEADTRLLQISYARIEELYFQNPTFGFYFLKLSTARLFENVARLERELSLRDAEIRRLTAAPLPEASLKQA
jgi:hypothetical protein